MNNTLRISLIKINTKDYIDDASLVSALRSHLHWEVVHRDAYNALYNTGLLPSDVRLVIDHGEDHDRVVSVDDALALYEVMQTVQQNARKTQSASVKRAVKKVAKKKGLTARQQRELDELRQELEKANG